MTVTSISPPLALNTPGEDATKTIESFPSFVNALPVRRKLRIDHVGGRAQEAQTRVEIKESVILRHDLATEPGWILLRVKHVAIDFSTDFSVSPGTVPGRIAIGKLHKYPVDGPWSPADKFLVFPTSRCLYEGAESGVLCDGCVQLQTLPPDERDTYRGHKKWPCTRNPTFGRDLPGGFQDYMQIRSPQNSLIRLSEHISVHDCCFLLEIAMPLYSFCEDTLCEIMDKAPGGRILILLNDSAREANDCLLVIHHLNLDHSLFTFSDVAALQAQPELLQKYTKKFNHVLVFSRQSNAFEMGLQCAVSTGLAIARNRYTLTVFSGLALPASCHQNHPDIHISQVQLSFKDRYLFEKLLETVSDLNYAQSQRWEEEPAGRSQSQSSEGSLGTTSSANSGSKKRLRFKDHTEVIEPVTVPRRNPRWLHCDYDFGLISDHQEFDQPADCHSSGTINRMLRRGCQLQRVFYTNRPQFYPTVNALVLSPVLPEFM